MGGGGVQRWVKFIKYLSRWDWDFTVITAEVEESSPGDESLLAEVPKSVKIIRVALAKQHRKRKKFFNLRLSRGYWQRWMSAFVHVVDSRYKWNNIVQPSIENEISQEKYDALIFTLPPYSMGKLAADFTAKHNIPVFLDLRDPWTINPYKIHSTPVHSYLDRSYERSAISGIEYCISAYRSTLDHFSKYISNFTPSKAILIPNGFDIEDFVGLRPEPLAVAGGFNLAFSGTFYSHVNNPRYLFAALRRLREEGYDIHFHHIGSSVYDIVKLAQKYTIQSQVHIWSYQEHKKCLRILKSMDALCVILDERIKHADKTVGGKLYEYLGLKKPVLAMVPKEGEASKIINETNAGIVCSSYKITQICQALKKIIAGQMTFTFAGIEKYSREKQAMQLKSFIEARLKK
jgi:glycosyltransferase involved in cell wall biosynthesis